MDKSICKLCYSPIGIRIQKDGFAYHFLPTGKRELCIPSDNLGYLEWKYKLDNNER